MKNTEVLEFTQDLCKKHNCKLLYLVVFGSNLYGTSIQGKSDLDVKGVFLPSLEDLVLRKDTHSIHYSSGNDKSKNSVDDIDVDMWSLQYWLQNLLPICDTNAIDLLYSFTNKDCIIYKDEMIDSVFSNALKLADTTTIKTPVNYSLGQAKKYGIKGSRLGALKRIKEYLDSTLFSDYERLLCHYEKIVEVCNDKKYCFVGSVHDEEMLNVCGKWHNFNITIEEFYDRIKRDYEHYGNRAEVAEKNNGIDFKALSHAVRAIYQTQELLLTGGIVFPLKKADELKRIKTGEYSWAETEKIILDELKTLEDVFEKSQYKSKPDYKLIRKIILGCYKNGEWNEN